MTNPTDTNETDGPTTIHAAQLYWDDQDSSAAGWWLRYTDVSGTEQGEAVDGAKDDSTETLAAEVAGLAIDGTGRIKVYRGGQQRGWIDLRDGQVAAWCAL